MVGMAAFLAACSALQRSMWTHCVSLLVVLICLVAPLPPPVSAHATGIDCGASFAVALQTADGAAARRLALNEVYNCLHASVLADKDGQYVGFCSFLSTFGCRGEVDGIPLPDADASLDDCVSGVLQRRRPLFAETRYWEGAESDGAPNGRNGTLMAQDALACAAQVVVSAGAAAAEVDAASLLRVSLAAEPLNWRILLQLVELLRNLVDDKMEVATALKLEAVEAWGKGGKDADAADFLPLREQLLYDEVMTLASRVVLLAGQHPEVTSLQTDITKMCFPDLVAGKKLQTICLHCLEVMDALLGRTFLRHLLWPHDVAIVEQMDAAGADLATVLDMIPWRDTHDEIGGVHMSPASHDEPPMAVQTLSQEPPVFFTAKLLAPMDCDHIIELAESYLGQASGHVNTGVATLPNSMVREDDVLRRLQTRIAQFTGVPEEIIHRSMEVQVIHYGEFGHINPHHDSSTVYAKHITVFLYLSDVVEDGGGETGFPLSRSGAVPGLRGLSLARHPPGGAHELEQLQSTGELSNALNEHTLYRALRGSVAMNCDKGGPGIFVSPQKGAGTFWHNHVRETGLVDPRIDHTGCAVRRGEKWGLNWWISFDSASGRDAAKKWNASQPAHVVGDAGGVEL